MADPSKTEKPTPRKRQEARKKGQVAKSIEAATAASFLTGLILLKIFGPEIVEKLKNFTEYMFKNMNNLEITEESILAFEVDLVVRMVSILLPFMIAIVIAVAFINIAQVGLKISLESIKPDLKKLNPVTGLGRLVSKKGIENLVKSLLKLGLIGWAVYGVIKKELVSFYALSSAEITMSFLKITNICFQIAIRIAAIFIIIAIFDYIWQKYTFEQNLKMSKQEVKDEAKRTEGNPQIKSEIRKRMRQMMSSRMMSDVPESDVVVTNPIHLAVAIKYDARAMDAPKVVAKGSRLIAEQIKKVADENDIPIVENKPLARSLFQTVEVGENIPEDLFNAVAEVLTYVHQLTGKGFGL